MEFQIIKLQGAVFTPDLSITNSLSILNSVSKLLPGDFEGDPMSVPLPQDAPANIPRLQFRSKDGKWLFAMSLERADLIFQDFSLNGNQKPDETQFTERLKSFFVSLKEELNLRVQRLALITIRAAPVENAALLITRKFCKSEYQERGNAFNNSKKFEIHSYKKYMWDAFNLNSWVRVKATTVGDNSAPVLVLENDLNTLSVKEDPHKDFSTLEIENFYENAPEHIGQIVRKYFSEGV